VSLVLESLFIVALAGPEIAVVGLDGGGASAEAVADAARSERERGTIVLTTEQVWQRLTGLPTPRSVDRDALSRLLADAAEHEARFDTAGANALREQVLSAFDQSLRPTVDQAELAARAVFDQVAALLGEADRAAAEERALLGVRRFGGFRLDPARYPPGVVAFVESVRQSQSAAPRGRLRIEADGPGTVLIDGREVCTASAACSLELPAGAYRVWMVEPNGGSSLSHHLEVRPGESVLRVALGLESRLSLTPDPALSCSRDCGASLRALGARLGVDRILGVHAPGQPGPAGVLVSVSSGESSPWPPATVTAVPEMSAPTPRPRFSPWSLAPFGVGQFAQDRPVLGGTYLAAEVGLFVWHLVAWQRHAAAVRDDDFGREPSLRDQRNLSAGLFYGSLAAGIVEAVVVGIVTGE
jgi:hypothetical protein